MWISFLERVVRLSGGRMTGGIEMTPSGSSAARDRPAPARLTRVARRLAALADKPLNFDPAALAADPPASGWRSPTCASALPDEPPGPPVPGGSWQIARRLMRGYEFADPSIVRAYYDPELPLEQRDMLLKLRALGLATPVRRRPRRRRVRGDADVDGRRAHVWGWNYRTLAGHVEMGQMDWEVWKWLEARPGRVPRPRGLPPGADPQPDRPDRFSPAARARAAGVSRQHPAADADVHRARPGARGCGSTGSGCRRGADREADARR